jgi:hypothetical protein
MSSHSLAQPYRGRLLAALIALSVAAAVRPAVAADPDVVSRVRDVGDASIASLLREAAAGSVTFGLLVERINATNGVVYVEQGPCPHGLRACLLLSVVVAGPNRILRIHVDVRRDKPATIGSIGHELQHAIEALSEPGVTTSALLFGFFERLTGGPSARGQLEFETDAALRAGDQVLAEIERAQRTKSQR